MLFQRKWTFAHTFLEKVDSFACFFGDNGLFCVLLGRNWPFFTPPPATGLYSMGIQAHTTVKMKVLEKRELDIL